jgi:GntR family transcriptional regulator/MocR family aminotransferase
MIPVLNRDLSTPLYLQLFSFIKEEVLLGSMMPDEKMPSLRWFAKDLGVSLTTVELAYSQLLVEGYIRSKPQSGYYVNNITAGLLLSSSDQMDSDEHSLLELGDTYNKSFYADPSSFDFVKWKKCTNKILTDYPQLLLEESSPQGEEPLRAQIARYVYQSRGVSCTRDQILIGAGTQQITNLLAMILSMMGIEATAFEDPGYRPVRSTFIDRGFSIMPIPVGKDGIRIEELPQENRSAVYVSPSNQFPMGSVMPIARRYELLEWAKTTNSIIIEDDYDSELRYFGRPVPSLQGLDKGEHVVYLGSFSSTLFPAIKISYMILPIYMGPLLEKVLTDFTQTCSKTEQLALALYMRQGMYHVNIKKLRKLYAQKAHITSESIIRSMGKLVKILNNSSGLHMLLEVSSKKSPEQLCLEASALGIQIIPITRYTLHKIQKHNAVLIFYYTRIPLQEIDSAIRKLADSWLGFDI